MTGWEKCGEPATQEECEWYSGGAFPDGNAYEEYFGIAAFTDTKVKKYVKASLTSRDTHMTEKSSKRTLTHPLRILHLSNVFFSPSFSLLQPGVNFADNLRLKPAYFSFQEMWGGNTTMPTNGFTIGTPTEYLEDSGQPSGAEGVWTAGHLWVSVSAVLVAIVALF